MPDLVFSFAPGIAAIVCYATDARGLMDVNVHLECDVGTVSAQGDLPVGRQIDLKITDADKICPVCGREAVSVIYHEGFPEGHLNLGAGHQDLESLIEAQGYRLSEAGEDDSHA